MDRPVGRAIYTQMLNPRGGIESDLTAVRLADDHYRLTVGTAAIRRDMAWLHGHLGGARVRLSDRTAEVATLGLMGPQASALLNALGCDLSGLRYFHSMNAEITGIPVRATRLSYVGEHGFEISCTIRDVGRLWVVLAGAGAAPAGLYAQTSMRIEKRFLSFGHDMDGDTTPLDVGLGFAVGWGTEFIGRDALERQREEGAESRLVTLVLDDADANPIGDEPVLNGDQLIGKVTSAAFGHRLGRPCALALLSRPVCPESFETGGVVIAGAPCHAALSDGSAFDPDGLRMRPEADVT